MDHQQSPAPGSLSWRLSSHPITLLTFLAFRSCKPPFLTARRMPAALMIHSILTRNHSQPPSLPLRPPLHREPVRSLLPIYARARGHPDLTTNGKKQLLTQKRAPNQQRPHLHHHHPPPRRRLLLPEKHRRPPARRAALVERGRPVLGRLQVGV